MSDSIRPGSPRPRPPRPAPEPAAASSSFVPLVLLGVCLLGAAGGTWAFFEFFVFSKVPSELVGKWVVQGGEQDGATFDFYRNGGMVGRINMAGKEGIVNARVAVEGDNLLITTQNPRTGREETKTQRIKTLTANELVLEDERRQVFRMTRAD